MNKLIILDKKSFDLEIQRIIEEEEFFFKAKLNVKYLTLKYSQKHYYPQMHNDLKKIYKADPTIKKEELIQNILKSLEQQILSDDEFIKILNRFDNVPNEGLVKYLLKDQVKLTLICPIAGDISMAFERVKRGKTF